jgi:hypothetical protein
MPSGTASGISWAAPAASPSFKSQPGFCTAHPASRHAGSAARPPGAFFSRRYPKKPRLRGVSVACLCGGVSFSLLFGGRGIRRAGRLWPDPRFFRLSLDLFFLPRRLPLMAIRKATLVPAGLESAVSACTDPRGLSKRDAMHIVGTPDGPTRRRGALFERAMSVF